MPITLEQFGIDQLPAQDRLELVGLLWDSLSEKQLPPTPDWHKKEVEQRIARADTQQGVPLEVAIDKVLRNSKFDE